MKAQEMSEAVRQTEIDLRNALADTIDQHLRRLQDETGLVIDGVTIDGINSQALSEPAPRFSVTGVSIKAGLPDW